MSLRMTMDSKWLDKTVQSYIQKTGQKSVITLHSGVKMVRELVPILNLDSDKTKANPDALHPEQKKSLQSWLQNINAIDLELYELFHFLKYIRNRLILSTQKSADKDFILATFDHLETTVCQLWHLSKDLTKNKEQTLPKEFNLFKKNNIQTFFNAVPEILTLINQQGQILLANEKAMHTFHLSVNELENKNLFSLLPPDVAKPRLAIFKTVIQTSKPIQFEDESRGQYYLNSIYPIKLNSNAELLYIFISGNYTDKKMIVREEQASRQILRSVLETIPIRVFWKDKKSRYLGCNKLYAWDSGFSNEKDIIGKTDKDLWPDLAEMYLKEDKEIINSGKDMLNKEECYTLGSDKLEWYQKNKIPLRDAQNHIIGILGTYQIITPIRENLKKVQINEARYRSLFEDSPIPLWEEDFSQVKKQVDQLKKRQVKHYEKYFLDRPRLFDECMRAIKVVNVNQAALKFSKVKSKQEIMEFLESQYTQGSRELFLKELVTFCQGKNLFKSEPHVQNVQGELRWTIVQASIAPGYENSWAKVFVSVIDVTEQVQNELALRESENKYRVLFENANDAILIMGPYKIIACNPRTFSLFKMEGKDVLGKLPPTDLSPEYQDDGQVSRIKGYSILQQVLNGETKVFEWTHKRGDNSTFPAEISLNRFEIGDQYYIHALIRDITDRKKAEEKIRESEKKYRTLFETMAQGVLYQDKHGKIISLNPEMEKILGVPFNKIISKTTLPPECSPIHDDGTDFKNSDFPATIALQTGKEVKNVVMGILNQQSNEYKWIQVSAIPYPTIDGSRPEQVFSTFDDITQQIKTASELRKYAETQDILLQEVNHRVKNNLSAIISILHKEMDRVENDDKNENIHMLQNLEGRVDGLLTVHNLLSFSKWQPIQLDELCQKIVSNSIQGTTEEKSIKLVVSKTKTRVNSRIAHNLAIVLNELATNAIKYALNDRDEVKIRIYLRKINGNIKITFKDDGPGFPKSALDMKPQKSKIGFGLVNGIIIHSLHGKIKLYNKDGAVVEMLIPLKKSQQY